MEPAKGALTKQEQEGLRHMHAEAAKENREFKPNDAKDFILHNRANNALKQGWQYNPTDKELAEIDKGIAEAQKEANLQKAASSIPKEALSSLGNDSLRSTNAAAFDGANPGTNSRQQGNAIELG